MLEFRYFEMKTYTISGLLYKAILSCVIILLAVSACFSKPPDKKNVTFIITLQSEVFSQDGMLHIDLWNAKQQEILEKQANCVVSKNIIDETEEITCPTGILYQNVSPEEHIFSIRDITETLTIVSDSVYTGERYKIHLFGKSADNCNSTSADASGMAFSDEIKLNDLLWITTGMACP